MKPKKQKKRYEVVDPYTKKAHEQGFLARSIFKLEEISKKINLYTPGQKVLDLGSAPGSWLQFASQKVGAKGEVVGLDITEIKTKLANVRFFLQDISDSDETLRIIQPWVPFDLIQSDAMVKTSGIVESDCARSIQLVENAIALTQRGALKPGGKFLAKIFEGPGFNEFWNEFRRNFKGSKVFRPEAIRKGSREIYILGHLP